jgi:hypothetical membrane protein
LPQQKKSLLKIGATSGIATPILAFACILTAIAYYPQFSWTNNALSDLGIITGITGPIFNFGLCGSGFFALSFAVLGLFAYIGDNWIGKIGALTFGVTGLALMCIGFFPENVVPYHYLFSVTFFVLLPISLFIITGLFLSKRQAKMAIFTLLTAVAAITPWVLFFVIHYVRGVAIPEFVTGIAGSVWMLMLSCKMFKAASQSKKH